MLSFGDSHCQGILASSAGFEERLAATYYDAQSVYLKIANYTGDSKWLACARAAEAVYGSQYVGANGGRVPGFWNFSEGLTLAALGGHSSQAAHLERLLSDNAAYSSEASNLGETASANLSREVAFAILSQLNAELLGAAPRARTGALIDQALGHIDQWFVSRTAGYVRPFMFALTARTLIQVEAQRGDPRILPAVRTGADWLWSHTWVASARAFQYTDVPTSTGGTEPAPDLNLLIAPVYAWLWQKTGDQRYRDMADAIFAGGVTQAFLGNSKQFNQNYLWSFDYVTWTGQ
jgi:hypothetical protein